MSILEQEKSRRKTGDPLVVYGPPLDLYRPQPKQLSIEAQLKKGKRHNLLVGGSRSGKTFLFVKRVVERALMAPESDHLIVRFRGNAARASIWLGTLRNVRRMCFPKLVMKDHLQDSYVEMPNRSRIWIGGLDEKERVEKILGNEYCLDPASRVLTADLRWKPAGELVVGEELIAFPEKLEGHCILQPSMVERSAVIQARRFRIKTSRGETIVSAEHRFVVGSNGYRKFDWKKAESLEVGDTIRYATKPWEEGRSFDDGWLSGMLDGEGSVSTAGQILIGQKKGPVFDKVVRLLQERGIEHGVYECQKDILAARPSSIWEALRLLGIVRPVRLLPKHRLIWEGRRAFTARGAATGWPIDPEGRHVAVVEEIEDLGVGSVVSLGTSSKTLIADGFLGHNCTVYFNEGSQIPYSSVLVGRTRLAQVARCNDGSVLPQQEFADLNPVGRSHWSYREWIMGVNPENRRPIPGWKPDNAGDYFYAFVQPQDNAANLTAEYLLSLQNAPERYKRRFYDGQYVEDVEGALWTMEGLDHARVETEDIPETLDRVIIAVDPSGTDGDEEKRSDDVGIVAAARAGTGEKSVAYMLEDATCNEMPLEWGRRVVLLARKWRADRIVAERNFGGEMVRTVIDASARSMGIVLPPVHLVTASRGKALRAEPVSALYGQERNGEWVGDRVRHAGEFIALEEEMLNFSVFGYQGPRSPNRADAAVFALTELMLGEQTPNLWNESDMKVVA